MTLLVAATEAELCGRTGLVCGVGPVDAAAVTAHRLAAARPDAVLHVGLAGATGLAPGALVLGTEAVYADLAAAIPVVARVEPDAELLARAKDALPHAVALPVSTSAAVAGPGSRPRGLARPESDPTGLTPGSDPMGSDPPGAVVEAMEGFGVLRACELAGVPALELRAVSNELGEEDRERWELARGLEALRAALPPLLDALRDSASRR